MVSGRLSALVHVADSSKRPGQPGPTGQTGQTGHTGHTGQGSRVVLVLSMANFIIGIGAFVVIGMLEPLGDAFRTAPGTTGWVLTAYAIAYAILSPVLVSASGAVGRRRVLAFAVFTFGLACLLCAFANSFVVLLVGRVVAAAAAGMVTPVAAAVAAGLSEPQDRANAIAKVFIGMTLAQVFGLPLGSLVAYEFGWRTAFVIVTVLAIPVSFAIWRVVPAGLAFQAVGLGDLRRTVVRGRIMLAVAFTATYLSAIYTVYTYFAPILTTGVGFTPAQISIALLAFGLGAVVGNIAGGRLASRFGSIPTLIVLAAAQVGWLAGFSYLPGSDLSVMIFVFAWSTMGWSFVSGQQVRLIGLLPEAPSVVLALNASAIYVGTALGSFAGSLVISKFGLDALGIAASIGALIALVNLLASGFVSGDLPVMRRAK
ncbi:MAG: MFS transporter [Pseudomonadota bacterium]